jgi:hypothetical protein
MANATASYDSSVVNQRAQSPYKVIASTTVSAYAGTMAQVDSTGVYVAAAANGTNRTIVGQFTKDVSLPTADTVTPVREGDFVYENAAADLVVAGDAGNLVYAYDDHTVCHTAGSNAVAGIFLYFDAVSGKPVVRQTLESVK